MKKLGLGFLLFVLFFTDTSAQFKSFENILDYNKLSVALEPTKPRPISDFYSPWMDSIISIQREVSEYMELDYPLDTLLAFKVEDGKAPKEDLKKISFINFVQSLPELEIQMAQVKRKKKFSSHYYYEMQRLAELVILFDASKQDSNLLVMESVLRTMVFYYQNPSLMREKKIIKEYQAKFVFMRNEYANILSECFKTNNCKKTQISMLYFFALNAWSDIDLARSVLRSYFYQEWLYLFHGVEAHKLDINFISVAECYISLLFLYNHTGTINSSDMTRGFEKLMTLRFSSYEKEKVEKNLRIYLSNKYGIYPQ